MDDTYRFLRQVEHRLQILFDRQTHEMPRTWKSCAPWRSGWAIRPPAPGRTGPAPPTRFLADYRGKTELNRRILNHLLHDAFRGDDGAAVDPVVDLVLDPASGAGTDRRSARPLPVPRPARRPTTT